MPFLFLLVIAAGGAAIVFLLPKDDAALPAEDDYYLLEPEYDYLDAFDFEWDEYITPSIPEVIPEVITEIKPASIPWFNFDAVADYMPNFSITTDADKQQANLDAFRQVIRTGEGTLGVNGYRTLFGGKLFDSFADHPRIVVSAGGYKSSAAGAYQILQGTWDDFIKAKGHHDFSPESQDIAFIWLLKRRGAYNNVLNGEFEIAIRKLNKEWASLPESPYGQPVLSMAKATEIYKNNGGAIA